MNVILLMKVSNSVVTA